MPGRVLRFSCRARRKPTQTPSFDMRGSARLSECTTRPTKRLSHSHAHAPRRSARTTTAVSTHGQGSRITRRNLPLASRHGICAHHGGRHARPRWSAHTRRHAGQSTLCGTPSSRALRPCARSQEEHRKAPNARVAPAVRLHERVRTCAANTSFAKRRQFPRQRLGTLDSARAVRSTNEPQ